MTTLYAFFVFLVSLIPSKVILIQPVLAASPSPVIAQSTPPEAPRSVLPSPDVVRAYVYQRSSILGVNPKTAVCIVDHESQDCVNMRGDNGESRGCWMINKKWHPEVSDAVADSLASSTAWSLNRILKGYVTEWTTYAEYCR